MRQSGQSTASRRLESPPQNTDGRSESARFGTDEAIRLARVRRHVVGTVPSFPGREEEREEASTLHAPLRSPNNADTHPPVSFPPPAVPTPRQVTLHALQEWEGHVVDIGEDEFVARLVDLTAGRTHESEEAIIPMAEISERDASRMVAGSLFCWVIGYERSPEGTKQRVSRIVFRDLPRVTGTDLRQGEEWADKVAPALSL